MEDSQDDCIIFRFEYNGIENILENLIEGHNSFDQRSQISLDIISLADSILQEYITNEEDITANIKVADNSQSFQL